jgi:hypothetical protein
VRAGIGSPARKLGVAIALVAMAVLAFGGVAASQTTGYQLDGVTVNGSTLHVHSNCWAAGGGVDVTIASTNPVSIGTIVANSAGIIDGDLTIPADHLTAGVHTITLTGRDCNGNARTQSFEITLSGSSSSSSGALAFTGGNIAMLLGIGAALVIVGTSAVMGFRRRRRGFSV